MGIEGRLEGSGVRRPANVLGAAFPDFKGGFARESGMGTGMVFALDVAPKTQVEFVYGGDFFEVQPIDQVEP